jgi:hypothetical protein
MASTGPSTRILIPSTAHAHSNPADDISRPPHERSGLVIKGSMHRSMDDLLVASSHVLVEYLTQSYGASKLLAALDATGATEWLGETYANRRAPDDAV